MFKIRFPKCGPTYWRQVVNPWHQTSQGQSVAKPGGGSTSGAETEKGGSIFYISMKSAKKGGKKSTILKDIGVFWKKVQGQKHPGRWGSVEHQIPSIKVMFKTNAKSHKHPGIKLLSSESKTQLVNQRKQNSYRRAYIYIYINTELLDGNKCHQEETHHPTYRFRRLFLDLLSMGWRGCASTMGAIKLPPSCSSPKIMTVSINSYSITYAVEEFLLPIIPNSVIVWSLQ